MSDQQLPPSGSTGAPGSAFPGHFVVNPRSPEIDAAEAEGIRDRNKRRKLLYKLFYIAIGIAIGIGAGIGIGWLIWGFHP